MGKESMSRKSVGKESTSKGNMGNESIGKECKRKEVVCMKTMSEKNIVKQSIDERQAQVREKLIEQYIRCRKEKNLTQAEVADALGTKRPSITRFENGTYNPTLDFLVKVAEGMGMELEINLVDRRSEYEGQ